MYDNKFDILFNAIETYLSENEFIIIGIDGKCGGGKTYLSEKIQNELGCNVVHVDDFFLPFELRSEKRMAEIGGNIQSERLLHEILKPLVKKERISYKPYNCKTGDFADEISFQPEKITVIEGTYSCMDSLIPYYNLKIFVNVSEEIRMDRLRKRCNTEEYERFRKIWIPREELYFDKCRVMNKCDYIIDTSDFGRGD